MSATWYVNASTITILYEFPFEEGDIGPFVSNEILWLKYILCLLKLWFFCYLFLMWVWFFNWHVMQSLHNGSIKFEHVFSDPACLFVLFLKNVKCEMLGVSYLVVNRVLLIQMFGILKF